MSKMLKKACFSASFIMVVVLVISAPVSGETKYPEGIELYPAIYGAFSELYPNARYRSIDFYNNTYTYWNNR